MSSPVQGRRIRVVVATTAALVGLLAPFALLGPSALAPANASTVTTTDLQPESTQAPRPPKVVGKKCGGATGVTVVVDFRKLHNPSGKVINKIKIGCARGAQDDGFTALLGAGFDVDPSSPFVCEIDNRPLPEDSNCAENGYWAYSHGERGGDWVYSGVGPADWQPPAGSLEGWSWAPYDKVGWELPRVTPSELFPPL